MQLVQVRQAALYSTPIYAVYVAVLNNATPIEPLDQEVGILLRYRGC